MTDQVPIADADWDDFKAEMEAEMPGHPESDAEAENRINWILGKLSAIDKLLAKNTETAKVGKRHWEDWAAGDNGLLERQASHWRREVASLAPSSSADAKKAYGKLSRTLPNGTIGFRQKPDTVEITDEAAAVVFARQQMLTVKTVRTVSVTTLKDHAKKTGETEGDGWHLETGKSEFYVTPAP